jgi:hypothetical protein
MSLRHKFEIEPLTDARLSKIKKSLFDRLDTEDLMEHGPSALPGAGGRSWMRVARVGFGMVAAAALVLAVASRWPASRHADSGVNPSRIVTGTTESHLVVGDNAIDVSPNSALLASGDDEQGILLVLERGSVSCEVAPRRGRPPFVVQAGSARVRVVGTQFTVTRVEDGATVQVAHGTVEVSSGGATFLVREGEGWPPSSAAAAEEAESAARTPPAPASAGIASEARVKAALGPSLVRRLVPSTPANEASVAAPPTDLASRTPAGAPSAEPTPQDLFEQATLSEKKDPAGASVLYERLESTSGPWAANALFAQGRLEADLGHAARARQILDAYLVRYPLGRNAADARTLLDRLKSP